MHLGLILYGDLGIRTGGFIYDRHVVEGLRRAGHKVSIHSLAWRSYLPQLTDNFKSLIPWLFDVQPDILLQDELVHPSFFIQNRYLKREYDKPLISIVHHLRSSEVAPEALKLIYRAIERAYLKTVDGYICNSQTTLDSLRSLSGSDITPAIVAYPGRDHVQPNFSEALITERSQEPGPIRLLFLGSIIPRKGLVVLIEALAGMDHNAWRLDVVGDDTIDAQYTISIKRRIEHHRLQPNINWQGMLDDSELQAIWSRTHALVVPSSYEGFGIVYLEAMAYGVIPIASSAGGANELIEHDHNGFLVRPGDVVSLRSHLQTLHDDRSAMGAIAHAGQQRYNHHPMWNDTVTGIQSFLLERISDLKNAPLLSVV